MPTSLCRSPLLDEGTLHAALRKESDVGSPRLQIEDDSEDRLRIAQVTFVGSAYTAHNYLDSVRLSCRCLLEAHYGSVVTRGEA